MECMIGATPLAAKLRAQSHSDGRGHDLHLMRQRYQIRPHQSYLRVAELI